MTTTTNDVKVTVAQLQVGDYLPQTKRTIAAIERGSVFTKVTCQRDNGNVSIGSWRNSTDVWIERS